MTSFPCPTSLVHKSVDFEKGRDQPVNVNFSDKVKQQFSEKYTQTDGFISVCIEELRGLFVMGGGDLNSKKSWHPNTIKNQERVWKAEQAAAEEKKRIMELQHERAVERDRAELNDLAKCKAGSSTSNDDRLHWMYDKPDKKVQQEDYLLGKAIEKNYDQPEKCDEVIPAVARRVVGSSMLTAGAGDVQVDLARKLREDPLLLVKERERAARAALLNNPLQRKRLTELLRKEQEQKKESKSGKKTKKEELDNVLAAKINALGGDKGLDIAALLASDDSSSSSESSDEERQKRKKKKKKEEKTKKPKKSKKKNKKRSKESNTDSSSCDKRVKRKIKNSHRKNDEMKRDKRKKESDSDNEKNDKGQDRYARSTSPHKQKPYDKGRKRRSESSSDREFKNKKSKKDVSEDRSHSRDYQTKRHRDSSENRKADSRRSTSQDRRRKYEGQGRSGRNELNEAEKAARLASMAAAGAEREQERGRRVARQRAAAARDDTQPRRPRDALLGARALPDSLESRIHSNRHYIQRDKRHMNEHFARR